MRLNHLTLALALWSVGADAKKRCTHRHSSVNSASETSSADISTPDVSPSSSILSPYVSSTVVSTTPSDSLATPDSSTIDTLTSSIITSSATPSETEAIESPSSTELSSSAHSTTSESSSTPSPSSTTSESSSTPSPSSTSSSTSISSTTSSPAGPLSTFAITSRDSRIATNNGRTPFYKAQADTYIYLTDFTAYGYTAARFSLEPVTNRLMVAGTAYYVYVKSTDYHVLVTTVNDSRSYVVCDPPMDGEALSCSALGTTRNILATQTSGAASAIQILLMDANTVGTYPTITLVANSVPVVGG